MRVRRKKLRGQGGEITVATPQNIDKVKAEIRKKISSGEYTVGQQIAPRKYEKMALNENGEIVRSEFVVEGRKQPLVEIRERTLKSQEKYMRQRCDDDEYQNLTGCKNTDIQTKVETPEVYIVVRSGSSDVEQLTYVDTRLECLEELSIDIKTSGGNDVADKMRFFHGDSPARQLESGQQKGGNFYCSGCGANAQQAYQLDICFSCHYLSLIDRQQLVLAGPPGRKNSLAKAPKPFQKLKKDELIRELNTRGIYEGESKKELEKLLTEELHGVQRVPALLYNNPTATLESINCDNTGCSRVESSVVSDPTTLEKTINITGSTSCSRVAVVTNPGTAMPNSGTMGNDTCVTKLGKGIEFVLGKSAEVLEFDKARQKHKQSPSDKFILDKFIYEKGGCYGGQNF
ncbi:Hypothetical predicted protein [Paramuricea clavata]|uniref:Uncharacterized protein n=1 Tax=Paramuricea clavata TaxID=317549 RepID=A0A7D9INT4_PARCT|nr:Hypothetical predicted protein [Paramuricea clavata]